jgi:hypothetical protein
MNAEKLNELKSSDYELQLRRECTCLYCLGSHRWLVPEEFAVDSSFYFQEVSNPDEDCLPYAISLLQGGKDFLIDLLRLYG